MNVPANWAVISTGGNCEAWERRIGTAYMLITQGGPDVPTVEHDETTLGIYGPDDQQLMAFIFPTVSQALAAADAVQSVGDGGEYFDASTRCRTRSPTARILTMSHGITTPRHRSRSRGPADEKDREFDGAPRLCVYNFDQVNPEFETNDLSEFPQCLEALRKACADARTKIRENTPSPEHVARPRVQITLCCPFCGFALTPITENETKYDGVTAMIARCDSCVKPFPVTVDDLRDAQHRLLIALGEA